MKVLSRPVNKGETFPCSFRSAKELFKDTDVTLNFSRTYGTFVNTPDMFYCRNNIRGIILSSMYMYAGNHDAMLSFYVVKSNRFNRDLQTEYESEFLPQYLQLYKRLVVAGPHNSETTVMLVELVDNALKLHTFKFR